MRYVSLFSGIEAAAVAWQPLGFELCAVSEIEPFPCSVLAHHYPSVPNLGDITKITREQIAELGKIDLVVGGFPCQDVSVAGKRAGLKNDDGSATRSGLFFDAMRIVEWIKPRWTVIENVPGLFSSNTGRDFAAVVGEMAGCEFDVPADGWRSSGVAIGPRGLVEWTVLDAQYHGLAQRRRRVFLVRDSGNWSGRPPLFLEPYRLQGNPAPRRETGESLAPTISARTQGGGGLGTDFDLDGGLIPQGHCGETAPTLNAAFGSKLGLDNQHIDSGAGLFVAHSLRADGFDASEDGTGRGTPLIAVAFDCKSSGQNGFGVGEITSTMRSMGHAGSHQNGGGHLAVAFQSSQSGVRLSDTHATLDSNNGSRRHNGVLSASAFHENQRGELTISDTAGTLKCNGGKPGQGYPAVAVALRGREGGATAELSDVPSALRASGGGGDKAHVLTAMQVRRLTPLECCRLQGFSDSHLNILHRNKPAADGNKYKALGNSFAVPVVRWIGERIQSAQKHDFLLPIDPI